MPPKFNGSTTWMMTCQLLLLPKTHSLSLCKVEGSQHLSKVVLDGLLALPSPLLVLEQLITLQLSRLQARAHSSRHYRVQTMHPSKKLPYEQLPRKMT
ncbi:uncharacterized protein EDB91DRAFT_1107574 [Suillus paluster]|uniref:uncharacterized protein n=1 Tax=Suillus paluster TaxID=48578 RepID=UPI001B85D944|nr:uncharacterized protein EDB91DRAFT_1107574 [Suillus paluster]KAG1750455.1 hypothetical protein EDB91DRAFT_1107574 [Suillus paluster]